MSALPDLLIDLEIARSDGSYKKMMVKYANLLLILILDEWLFLNPMEMEQRYLRAPAQEAEEVVYHLLLLV